MAVAELTRLFKTLGDPTRLRLLRLLAAEELSVMELAEATQLAQSRISNHLKLLREEGLVQERREGSWRNYRVDLERLPVGLRGVWNPVAEALEDETEFLADRARLERVIAARSGRNGRFFDSLAEHWDDLRAGLFGDGIGREVLRLFVPPGIAVADLGCGTGYVVELLAGRVRRLVAVDSSASMLEVARRKVASLGAEGIELRQGDAADPNVLEPAAFDLVTLVMVLHHVEDPAGVLGAAARGVAPGGRVLIADLAEHNEAWVRETLGHRFLGFSRERIETLLLEADLRLTGWSVLPGRPWETPDGHTVSLPNGFVAVAQKPEASR